MLLERRKERKHLMKVVPTSNTGEGLGLFVPQYKEADNSQSVLSVLLKSWEANLPQFKRFTGCLQDNVDLKGRLTLLSQ